MTSVDLRHGAASDVGLVREVNEDAFLLAPPVFVVADGMGGHTGGDVASRIVVEEFGALESEARHDPRSGAETVAATLVRAQARIREYGEAQRGSHPRRRAGTTAVVALLVEDDDGPAWLLANLGDSRAYCFDRGHLDQVSVDHSVVQELVDAGQITPEQAATHPERHVITRALGSSGRAEPDFFLLPVSGAERLLLCTDGVTGMIDDEQVAAVLADVRDPREAAERLVRAAVEAGGRDNATAVVIDAVTSRAGPPAGPRTRGLPSTPGRRSRRSSSPRRPAR